MTDRASVDPSRYEALIDAEREALARSGRPITKILLARALRDATGLGLRDAKQCVEWYLGRHSGRIAADAGGGRPGGWIDDLIDAERAAARADDRPVNKITLIKVVRAASGQGLKESKDAVDDYLRRRGGEDLPAGTVGISPAWPVALALALAVAAWLAWASR